MMGMEQDVSQILEGIGPRLRELRTARKFTLADLARLTGLSVSLLSRLETGHRQPTLDALIPLAQTYRVPLDRLVGMPPTGDPRIHIQPQRLNSGGIMLPLTPYRSRVQVFKHVLGPSEPRLTRHEGQAWLYVLSGGLRLILDAGARLKEQSDASAKSASTRTHLNRTDADSEAVTDQLNTSAVERELQVGEIAEFNAMTPHWFGPVGESVEILHILGPRGETSAEP